MCRDPPEPTGDEPEDFEYEAPKIYEPVSIRRYLVNYIIGIILDWTIAKL